VLIASANKAVSKTLVWPNGNTASEVNDNVVEEKSDVSDGIMRLDESGDEVWL
jgi:hypothetical protein